MTMRDVSIAITNINLRTHNTLADQMNMHGHKMEYKIPETSENDFNGDNKKAEKAMKDAIKRKFGNG